MHNGIPKQKQNDANMAEFPHDLPRPTLFEGILGAELATYNLILFTIAGFSRFLRRLLPA